MTQTGFTSACADNPVSRAFETELRGLGADTSGILWSGRGRMGVYYAEHGSGQRGSSVVYDRDGSTISMLGADEYDFNSMLDDVDHLHITGITPSLSENAYLVTLKLVETASAKGCIVSCDLNYRKKLWNWGTVRKKGELAAECMEKIVQYADWVICNEEDASDVFGINASETDIYSGKINAAGYISVAEQLMAKFPRLSKVAITLRESISADHNNWGAMLFERDNGAFFAPLDTDGNYKPYEIRNIVDRFGGGDSFGAGLIHALYSDEYSDGQSAIRFAVAASCLKHSVYGDYNYNSRKEVENLMQGSGSGRVAR